MVMNATNVISLASMRSGPGRAGMFAEMDLAEMIEAEDSSARAPELDEMSTHLVTVAQEQDREAFAALFLHFAPRLKSYFRRYGEGDGQTDEVLQETFAAIWTKARQFDPSRASASTWIYTIARNQRIDAFRRERRPQFDPNDPAFVPEDVPDGEISVTQRERVEHVSEAMAELSDEQREVLRLAFFEDEPHEAIARMLGLPIGTVKSRIRLAYGHLRTRLSPTARGLL
jgi:RNA polymerase sigma-70 factor (ECF subfamily)